MIEKKNAPIKLKTPANFDLNSDQSIQLASQKNTPLASPRNMVSQHRSLSFEN